MNLRAWDPRASALGYPRRTLLTPDLPESYDLLLTVVRPRCSCALLETSGQPMALFPKPVSLNLHHGTTGLVLGLFIHTKIQVSSY